MNPPFQTASNLHEACLLDFLGHTIPKADVPKAVHAIELNIEQGMQWDNASAKRAQA